MSLFSLPGGRYYESDILLRARVNLRARGDRPQRRADVFVHACLPRDSGERPDGALLAEALGERLLRLDDERRAELLKDLLEGLQRELRMTREDPA